MFKKPARLAIFLSCALMIGCPQRSAVWIEPNATANHLIIGIGERMHGPPPANNYGLTVVRCGGESRLPGSAVWSIARVSEGPVPARVLYGSAPPGYQRRVSPQALKPGCYRVQDSGSGVAIIDVGASGEVSMK